MKRGAAASRSRVQLPAPPLHAPPHAHADAGGRASAGARRFGYDRDRWGRRPLVPRQARRDRRRSTTPGGRRWTPNGAETRAPPRLSSTQRPSGAARSRRPASASTARARPRRPGRRSGSCPRSSDRQPELPRASRLAAPLTELRRRAGFRPFCERVVMHATQQLVRKIGRPSPRLLDHVPSLARERAARCPGVEAGTGCRKQEPACRRRSSPGLLPLCCVSDLAESLTHIDDLLREFLTSGTANLRSKSAFLEVRSFPSAHT